MSHTKEVSIKSENAINAFIVSTEWNKSYNMECKKLFHSRGKKVMRIIKDILGVDGEIRSCVGGMAVSGEIIFHSDTLYIMFCDDKILYRHCNGRKDYCGGTNHYKGYKELLDIENACKSFKYVGGIV